MRLKASSGELIFTLCILVYVIILTILSFSYSPAARVFPTLVLFPTIVFIVLRLVSMANPKFSEKIEPDFEMFGMESLQEYTDVNQELNLKERTEREFKAVLWIISLIGWVYILGILPAVIVFVFLFTKIYGRKSFFTSVVLTAATWAFIYFLFVMVLRVRFYIGFVKIPFLE